MDGAQPLDPEVWDRVGDVRSVVVAAVRDLAPPDTSFVFTDHLTETPADEHHVRQLIDIADALGAQFVPVRLICEWSELERRIEAPGRVEQMKERIPATGRHRGQGESVLATEHPNEMTLDITHLPAADSALAIGRHLEAVAAGVLTGQ